MGVNNRETKTPGINYKRLLLLYGYVLEYHTTSYIHLAYVKHASYFRFIYLLKRSPTRDNYFRKVKLFKNTVIRVIKNIREYILTYRRT